MPLEAYIEKADWRGATKTGPPFHTASVGALTMQPESIPTPAPLIEAEIFGWPFSVIHEAAQRRIPFAQFVREGARNGRRVVVVRFAAEHAPALRAWQQEQTIFYSLNEVTQCA